MKVMIAAAFGIGYVLGARAGRERYEEIRRAAEKIQSEPHVQDVAHRAEAAVREATARVQEDPRFAQATEMVREKVAASSGGPESESDSGSAPDTDESLGEWSTKPDEYVEVTPDEPTPGAHRA